MTTLFERTNGLWDSLRRSAAELPTRFAFPSERVDVPLGGPFTPNEHYFQIRVNELFLSYKREWFSTYLPVVLFITEFLYDDRREVLPFVVGPSMLEQNGTELPESGMIFSDTRVAGVHPYRGGRLNMTAILYRTERTNYARQLLKIVENAATLLDFSVSLGPYTRLANVIMDGLEALFAIGGMQPVIGWRQELDPDAGDPIEPGYFALVNSPESTTFSQRFYVRNRKLMFGNSSTAVEPYRASDYVLFSLLRSDERTDVTALPFQAQWERVQREALQPTEAHWRSAKANMLALYQSLVTSPDLTPRQAEQLADGYVRSITERRTRVEALNNLVLLGDSNAEAVLKQIMPTVSPTLEDTLDKSVSILDL